MSNVTVILPVHEFNSTVEKYINEAVTSVLNQSDTAPKLLVVYTHRAEEGGVLEYLNGLDPERVSSIKNEGKTDFSGQVNFGAKSIKTPYFSILEYDDSYSLIYFRNIEKHIKSLSDVALFLPITIDVDDETNQPVQMVNQNIWSTGYAGENGTIGYLNLSSINEFSFYTIGGGVFKTADFLAIGGLKSNIKLAFTFEYLLRHLQNGNKVYTITKYGYKHTINRKGSLFMTLGASLSDGDRAFWFETARKESHFFNDREIETSPLTVAE